MNTTILSLLVIACVIAVSFAFPAEELTKGDLTDSFGHLAQHNGNHKKISTQDEGDQALSRNKRLSLCFGSCYGGYGGYGGYGFRRRRFFRRRGFGGYGFYG